VISGRHYWVSGYELINAVPPWGKVKNARLLLNYKLSPKFQLGASIQPLFSEMSYQLRNVLYAPQPDTLNGQLFFSKRAEINGVEEFDNQGVSGDIAASYEAEPHRFLYYRNPVEYRKIRSVTTCTTHVCTMRQGLVIGYNDTSTYYYQDEVTREEKSPVRDEYIFEISPRLGWCQRTNDILSWEHLFIPLSAQLYELEIAFKLTREQSLAGEYSSIGELDYEISYHSLKKVCLPSRIVTGLENLLDCSFRISPQYANYLGYKYYRVHFNLQFYLWERFFISLLDYSHYGYFDHQYDGEKYDFYDGVYGDHDLFPSLGYRYMGDTWGISISDDPSDLLDNFSFVFWKSW
jgi:hypothetical protein